MEAEGTEVTTAITDKNEVQLERETPALVETVRTIMTQKFGKSEKELCSFKTNLQFPCFYGTEI